MRFFARLHQLVMFSVVAMVATAFLSLAPVVSADENFDISLLSRYTVQPTGTTKVEQEFTLTNKTPTLYVSQYAIEVGSNKIENVRVFDKSGDITSQVVSTDKKTSIAIEFKDVSVGEGKKRSFTVQFESKDIAIISGNVVEVYIPKFSDLSKYQSYAVELRVPDKFGRPVRVEPPAVRTANADSFTILSFEALGDRGVTAVFGEKQVYDFTLRYHLENPTNSPGLAQVALPPDTSYQKVLYNVLDPQPKQMERDKDGNWIATYEVSAGKTAEVVATGKATIFLEPLPDVPVIEPLPEHTGGQKYWPTDHSKITELAGQHSSPKAIYDFVVKTLTYDYDKLSEGNTRLGAVDTLEYPDQAACQEFTDVFVTMCRAAGIPARRITGYAYTQNERLRPLSLVDDVLHAWPEYYDAETKQWVPVDPTWGNTTGGLDYFSHLDFNHVTFAIQGVSDTLPYPAGSYKSSVEKTKDVEVNFGETQEIPKLAVTYRIHKKPFWLSPFKNQYELLITNQVGVAWYNLPLTAALDQSNFTVEFEKTTVEALLPFQTLSVPFEVKDAPWLRQHQLHLTLTLQDLSSTHGLNTGLQLGETIKTAPINFVGLGAGVAIVTIITGCLLVFRRKR